MGEIHASPALLAHAGDSFAQREKGILFAVIALVLLITGPGRHSIDDVLLRRSRMPRN